MNVKSTSRPSIKQLAVLLVVAILFFYGMDQIVMSFQGLPLNPDLSPANTKELLINS